VMLQWKVHSWCFLGQVARIRSAEMQSQSIELPPHWQIKLEQGLGLWNQ
jgi:hypothetical protein